jgi:predicted sulfurtransferase
MDETEVKKTCHACGADITHARRHKNADGEYLCPKCFENRRQSSKERSRESQRTKSRRVVLCAILAAAGAWLFFKFLDIMNQPSDPDS